MLSVNGYACRDGEILGMEKHPAVRIPPNL